MNKVVINVCYGGFSLSMKALQLLYKKKGENYNFPYKYNYNTKKYYKSTLEDSDYLFKEDRGNVIENVKGGICSYDTSCPRHDKDLVEVVEELGTEANGDCAKLCVAEILGNIYRISEYDGWEWVETPESVDWITI